MRAHAVATIQIKRNALLPVGERQSENAKAAAQEEDEQAYPVTIAGPRPVPSWSYLARQSSVVTREKPILRMAARKRHQEHSKRIAYA
jgi:hypothetical protein